MNRDNKALNMLDDLTDDATISVTSEFTITTNMVFNKKDRTVRALVNPDIFDKFLTEEEANQLAYEKIRDLFDTNGSLKHHDMESGISILSFFADTSCKNLEKYINKLKDKLFSIIRISPGETGANYIRRKYNSHINKVNTCGYKIR